VTLTQPEKRSSTRIAVQTEVQANAIAARLAHGESADSVAHSLGLQAIHGADEARSAVSDANVAEAVFAMPPNSPPRVVRGRLSPFVVVQVQSVTAAVSPNFNASRDQIRQEMALEQARDLVDAATNTFDEARGGGATPVEAAQRAGLSVVVIPATDAQGRDPAGQPIPALSGEHNELLALAMRTPESETSDFTPVNDADVVVAVDRITPPSIRPLAQVRDELTRALVARELNRRMQEFVNTVTNEVESGRPLAAVAAAHHMRMAVRSQTITRDQATHLPSQRLAAGIFSAAEGGVASDVMVGPNAQGGGGALIAVVEHIRRIDPAQAGQQVQQARLQAQQQMAQQLMETIQAQITADAHVTRNQAVIRRNFRGSQDANASQDAAP
jgi:peptidyl-prolyl cis-trans isomerase D